jgi:hypothetical protein
MKTYNEMKAKINPVLKGDECIASRSGRINVVPTGNEAGEGAPQSGRSTSEEKLPGLCRNQTLSHCLVNLPNEISCLQRRKQLDYTGDSYGYI